MAYDEGLAKKHASEIDFAGKAMKGMIYVAPEGIESDAELAKWVDGCTGFVESLPPRKPKPIAKTQR